MICLKCSENRTKSPSNFSLDSGMLRAGVIFRPLGGGLGQHCFLGGFPAVLDERLLGDCGFVHSQMEDFLSFLELCRKSLDMHPFLPKSGSYFTRQAGALGNPKLKLFHLRHDLNRIYETRRLKGMSIPFLGSSK
jgi:hypothetical protein